MGTHPIFESDFDCLTDSIEMKILNCFLLFTFVTTEAKKSKLISLQTVKKLAGTLVPRVLNDFINPAQPSVALADLANVVRPIEENMKHQLRMVIHTYKANSTGTSFCSPPVLSFR